MGLAKVMLPYNNNEQGLWIVFRPVGLQNKQHLAKPDWSDYNGI